MAALIRRGSVVDRPSNHTRIALFGVADLPGFVDFLAGQADVGGGRDLVLARNMIPQSGAIRAGRNLAAFLRGVVFVGEAALRQRFDFQRVGLRAEGAVTGRLNLGHFFWRRRTNIGGFQKWIGSGLDHAVFPDEELGIRVDGQPVEQRLQLGA